VNILIAFASTCIRNRKWTNSAIFTTTNFLPEENFSLISCVRYTVRLGNLTVFTVSQLSRRPQGVVLCSRLKFPAVGQFFSKPQGRTKFHDSHWTIYRAVLDNSVQFIHVFPYFWPMTFSVDGIRWYDQLKFIPQKIKSVVRRCSAAALKVKNQH